MPAAALNSPYDQITLKLIAFCLGDTDRFYLSLIDP